MPFFTTWLLFARVNASGLGCIELHADRTAESPVISIG
jgi:hypothetical protein